VPFAADYLAAWLIRLPAAAGSPHSGWSAARLPGSATLAVADLAGARTFMQKLSGLLRRRLGLATLTGEA